MNFSVFVNAVTRKNHTEVRDKILIFDENVQNWGSIIARGKNLWIQFYLQSKLCPPFRPYNAVGKYTWAIDIFAALPSHFFRWNADFWFIGGEWGRWKQFPTKHVTEKKKNKQTKEWKWFHLHADGKKCVSASTILEIEWNSFRLHYFIIQFETQTWINNEHEFCMQFKHHASCKHRSHFSDFYLPTTWIVHFLLFDCTSIKIKCPEQWTYMEWNVVAFKFFINKWYNKNGLRHDCGRHTQLLR